MRTTLFLKPGCQESQLLGFKQITLLEKIVEDVMDEKNGPTRKTYFLCDADGEPEVISFENLWSDLEYYQFERP